MREAATKTGQSDRMQMWAGQAASMARAAPAADLATSLWAQSSNILRSAK